MECVHKCGLWMKIGQSSLNHTPDDISEQSKRMLMLIADKHWKTYSFSNENEYN